MAIILAETSLLPKLRTFYREVVSHMQVKGYDIWNEIYPLCVLEEDVMAKDLYILSDNSEIVAAFALKTTHAGAKAVIWPEGEHQACYLERFAVHPQVEGTGIAHEAICGAKDLAKTRGAALRLFVVRENKQALARYRQEGFRMAVGEYHSIVSDTREFYEWGMSWLG